MEKLENNLESYIYKYIKGDWKEYHDTFNKMDDIINNISKKICDKELQAMI